MKKKGKNGKFIKTRFDRFCLDCSKELPGYQSKRCRICAGKKSKTTFKKGCKPWNANLKMSEEHCKKLSKIQKRNPVNYWLGKKRSKEDRLKMSITHKELYKKDKNSLPSRKGLITSEETKQKQRIAAINNPMKKIKNTSIEIKMQKLLKEKGIKFEKDKPMLSKYRVDLFIKPNLVIECDGDYWHNRPGMKEKDEIRNNNLKKSGFRVLRFWEHEINSNLNDCWKIIKQEVYA